MIFQWTDSNRFKLNNKMFCAVLRRVAFDILYKLVIKNDRYELIPKAWIVLGITVNSVEQDTVSHSSTSKLLKPIIFLFNCTGHQFSVQ